VPITFKYERDKAKHAVLWLLHRHGGSLDKMKLLKLVFFADREHLAEHARPIVGGTYVAMPHGPVPSELYDDIKAAGRTIDWLGVDVVKIVARELPDEDMLSESDIEVLEAIDRTYGRYDSFSLRNLTHQLKAWRQAYPDDGSSHPLPYEAFFDDLPDRSDVLAVIEEDQENERMVASLRR
jgi:uncharacterized phage-associated protein